VGSPAEDPDRLDGRNSSTRYKPPFEGRPQSRRKLIAGTAIRSRQPRWSAALRWCSRSPTTAHSGRVEQSCWHSLR